ncbi:uncharacterized protein PHALS_00425 [Plasmopara halstedii]|uniref:Uncharacterized protein n=1 Tax=Plasmopara halstedii TaxID=4781 RepID=A0A0P1A684_PLAHL|nr:uncharacterized protein PHALS_00425 [Plasmopara halstedii]CEG36106.1 hypothetical protein PHALS_00425 [Plasmopara halstedii]|eukprot:XP_024572475.1 hypothetical protein PHALS_00425 [Plasmopara halstedii]
MALPPAAEDLFDKNGHYVFPSLARYLGLAEQHNGDLTAEFTATFSPFLMNKRRIS